MDDSPRFMQPTASSLRRSRGIVDSKQETVVKFQYSALSQRLQEIRLLDLSPKHPFQSLKCRIRRVSLKASPRQEYETVSYCWGDSTPCKTVIVDSATLLVPFSCWRILNRLAYEDRPRTLWIDAICIDQENESERNHQVSLMREIYSGGKRNLVYLGGAEDEASMTGAIDLLHDLHLEARNDFSFQESLRDLALNIVPRWIIPSYSTITKRGERLIHTFFSIPWFSRLWVLQETCLAADNSCILGRHQISLSVILEVARWLSCDSDHIPLALKSLPGLNNASTALEIHTRHRVDGSVDLETALRFGQNLQASLQHDKIYGLLGIVPRELREVDGLKPDYSKPWQEVFQEAVRTTLRETVSGPAILGAVSHRSLEDIQAYELPSWVPKLNRHIDESTDAQSIYWNASTASGHQPPETGRTKVGGCAGTLTLDGWAFDTVHCVTSVATSHAFDEEFFSGWIQELSDTAFYNDVPDRLDDDLLDRLVGADLNFARASEGVRLEAINIFKTVLDHQIESSQVEAVAASDSTTDSTHTVRLGVARLLRNRRMAITRNGYCVVAPKVAQPSDILTWMYGFESPLLLRWTGTYYLLLGVCVISELMPYQDGYEEFMAKLKREPMETFEIH